MLRSMPRAATGSSTSTITNSSATGITWGNAITLTSNLIVSGAGEITFSDAISGSGSITKQDSNTISLTAGINTYSGATTISAGTLAL